MHPSCGWFWLRGYVTVRYIDCFHHSCDSMKLVEDTPNSLYLQVKMQLSAYSNCDSNSTTSLSHSRPLFLALTCDGIPFAHIPNNILALYINSITHFEYKCFEIAINDSYRYHPTLKLERIIFGISTTKYTEFKLERHRNIRTSTNAIEIHHLWAWMCHSIHPLCLLMFKHRQSSIGKYLLSVWIQSFVDFIWKRNGLCQCTYMKLFPSHTIYTFIYIL